MNAARWGLTALAALSSACAALPPAELPSGAVAVHVALPRQVTALASEVDNLTLTLSTPGANAVTLEKCVDHAALVGGADVVFSNLQKSGYTLNVRAFAQDGHQLGQLKTSISVTGNGVDHVTATLRLDPAYVQPTTGTVVAQTAFTELPTVGTLGPTHTVPPAVYPGVAAAPDGAVWLAYDRQLHKLDAAGQVVATASLDGILPPGQDDFLNMAVDHHGNVWLSCLGSMLAKLSPEGTLLFKVAPTGAMGLALDAHDQPWAATDRGLVSFDVETGAATVHAAAEVSRQFGTVYPAIDPASGILWSSTGGTDQYGNGRVYRYAADGSYMGSTVVPHLYGGSLAVGPDGRLWTLTRPDPTGGIYESLQAVNPDGTLGPTVADAGAWCSNIVFDQQGHGWLARTTTYNNLFEFDANGKPLGVNTAPGDGGGVVLGTDGRLWMTGSGCVTEVIP